jgi:hypothetical protein
MSTRQRFGVEDDVGIEALLGLQSQPGSRSILNSIDFLKWRQPLERGDLTPLFV